MTQAPTPGPLSGDFNVEEYVADYEFRADEGSYSPTENERALLIDAIHGALSEASFSLAPTAPVEASGSERERLIEVVLSFPETVDLPTQRAEDLANEVLDALRPQPSGETREAIARLQDDADYFDHPEEGAETHRRALCWVAKDIRTVLSALRPAPVASGGQHSSATDFPPDDVLACVPVADAVALSASDRACYEYPGIDQTKERAAFVAGAMASAPAAETAGEAVAWVSKESLAGLAKGDAALVWPTRKPGAEEAPLYASPVPAQDDDRVRIAVEALEKARDRINVTRGPMGSFYRTESSAEALYEAKVAVGIGLSALKSTAAKEGGE